MPEQIPPPADENKNPYTRWGVGLILLSGIFFVILLAAPFLPFSTAYRVGIGGAAYACMQIAWWVGAVLAGPETLRRVRKFFAWKAE